MWTAPEVLTVDDMIVWQPEPVEAAVIVWHPEPAETAVAVDDLVIDLRLGEARIERASDVAPAEPT